LGLGADQAGAPPAETAAAPEEGEGFAEAAAVAGAAGELPEVKPADSAAAVEAEEEAEEDERSAVEVEAEADSLGRQSSGGTFQSAEEVDAGPEEVAAEPEDPPELMSPSKRSEAAASDSVVSVPSSIPSSPSALTGFSSGLPPDKLAALQILGLSVEQAVSMGIISADLVASSAATAAPVAAPEPAGDASASTAPGGLLGTWDAEYFKIEVTETSATFSTGEVLDLELRSLTTCCLRLDDQEHLGHLSSDGKRLHWDDGDVWTRE